jgi:site-specific DNA-methyltransferase (adenine-specific)
MKKIETISVFSSGTTANKSDRRMPYHAQGLTPTAVKRSGTDYGATGGSFKTPRPSHKPYIQEFTNYPVDLLSFSKDTKERLHPTQKPVAICEYLIRTYTNEGETVLDNCMGSGTTGIACLNTGRNFIGIEKDQKYFEIARNRIEGHNVICTP